VEKMRVTAVAVIAILAGLLLPVPVWADNLPSGDCGYYTNSSGHQVPRPCGDWRNDRAPPPRGATALCRDGTYSYSEHRSGTCSGHSGVASFLR
jgi:hypothetical protein